MKLKIEIKNRFTGKVIFEFETENNTVAKTINEYVRKTKEENGFYSRAGLTDADLTDANLTRADLTDANLTRADLTDANLTDANLTRANLTRANLTRADLTGANLTDANLTDADLTGANLTRANLTDADLTRADLTRADLTRADLTRADLTAIKADFFLILLSAKNEVSGLKQSLINGKVDGSTYTGACCCLVGTLANVKGCDYNLLPNITPNSNRPAERWFLAIKKGDTPLTNCVSKKTLEWVEEFEKLINF